MFLLRIESSHPSFQDEILLLLGMEAATEGELGFLVVPWSSNCRRRPEYRG